MKKVILLLSIAGFAVSANSQSKFSQTTSSPTGAILNASVDTMSYSTSQGYQRTLIGMTYTKVTGTGAGTAILEYRISPTDNYVSDAGDTLTITNVATRTYYWNKTNTARYWRIRVGGATTVTATVVAKLQN